MPQTGIQFPSYIDADGRECLGGAFAQFVWNYVVAVSMAQTLSSIGDQSLSSYALFVAIFLITAESPYQYIQHFQSSGLSHNNYPGSLLVNESNGHDTPHKVKFFTELAFILQRNDDQSIKEIGRLVEQITRKADYREPEASSFDKPRHSLVRDYYNRIQDKKKRVLIKLSRPWTT